MPFPRSNGFTYAQPDRHDELSGGTPDPVQADASQERKSRGPRHRAGATRSQRWADGHEKDRTKSTHEIQTLPVSDTLKRRARFARKKICSEWRPTSVR